MTGGPWRRVAMVALFVIGLDQLTKAWVVNSIDVGEQKMVLPFLDLVHVKNEGVAFGFLGGGSRAGVILVTVVALVFVLGWFARNTSTPNAWFAVGLLAGGALGNLIDRLARDSVVDFIDLPAWPTFNLADVAITLGAVTLALLALAPDEPEKP